MTQIPPPALPLESEQEIYPPPPAISGPSVGNPDLDPPPPSLPIDEIDEEDVPPPPRDSETSDLDDEDDYLGRNTPPPAPDSHWGQTPIYPGG